MTDQPPAPGYWKASDGNWYPPQGQAPPPSKRGGCMRWALIGFGVLVVLGIIGAIAGGGGDDAANTSATTTQAPGPTEAAEPEVRSRSANEEHPPADDVKLETCTSQFGYPKAAGTVHNNSSKPSNYVIHVEFVAGNARVAEGYDLENEVGPGQSAAWDAIGDREASDVTCRVTSVERTSASG